MGTMVGIDPSLTSTGIVAGSGPDDFGAWLCKSRKLGDTVADRFRRYSQLLDEVEGVLVELQPIDAVFIEGYAFAANGRAVYTGEYGGQLRALVYQYAEKLVEVAPTTLKRFATGRGQFRKGEGKAPMVAAVLERWGYESHCDDDADAFALWRLGLCCEGLAEAVTSEQHEAVYAVRNPRTAPRRKGPRPKAGQAKRAELF